MPGFYPDRPLTATDGDSFEDLCRRLHWHFFRERIGRHKDRHQQFTIGENPQGVEFKELQKSFERFHIEIEERVSVDRSWWSSGIMRNDNTKRYICGNDEDIFAFWRDDLRQWREVNKPKEVWYGRDCGLTDSRHLLATIRSFVLPKNEAWMFCLYRFRRFDYGWEAIIRNRGWMTEHLKQSLGPLADTPLGYSAIERLLAR